MLTYGHRGAVLANATVQNDMEVVVAGVEGPSDDAHDGEHVQLQSNNGQLRKQVKVKLGWRYKAFSQKKGAYMKATGMPSIMGGQSQKINKQKAKNKVQVT